MFKFELNEKVKVKVTGYQGCITAAAKYLNGVNQYEFMWICNRTYYTGRYRRSVHTMGIFV